MARDAGRATGVVGLVVGINLLIGFLGYFVAFLFAYGFVDEVGLAHHVTFLVLVAGLAVVAATVSTPMIKPATRQTALRTADLALRVSVAVNLLAVGIGSIISARYKDEGSVSAGFSTATDVLVAVSLVTGAVIASWLAWRALPTIES